jgi:hypothetical protein
VGSGGAELVRFGASGMGPDVCRRGDSDAVTACCGVNADKFRRGTGAVAVADVPLREDAGVAAVAKGMSSRLDSTPELSELAGEGDCDCDTPVLSLWDSKAGNDTPVLLLWLGSEDDDCNTPVLLRLLVCCTASLLCCSEAGTASPSAFGSPMSRYIPTIFACFDVHGESRPKSVPPSACSVCKLRRFWRAVLSLYDLDVNMWLSWSWYRWWCCCCA